MGSFPDYDRSQLPDIRFADLHERPAFTALRLTDAFSADRELVGRDDAGAELRGGRQVHTLSVRLRPRVFAEGAGARRLIDLCPLPLKPLLVRESEASLRAEPRPPFVGGLVAEGCAAVFARLLHSCILRGCSDTGLLTVPLPAAERRIETPSLFDLEEVSA